MFGQTRLARRGAHQGILVLLLLLLTVAGAFVALETPTVAGGASAPQVAPKSGNYTGFTGQHKAVKFRVSLGTVKNAQVTIDFGPCTSTFYFPSPAYDAKVNKFGRFSTTTGIGTLRGKFVNATTVNGTATGSSSCAGTKTVTYSAKRR